MRGRLLWAAILGIVLAASAGAEGPARTLALAAGDPTTPTPPAIRVLSQTEGGIDLEFTLPNIQTQEIDAGGEAFQVLTIEGGEMSGADGAPMLPVFGRLVAIPDLAGVALDVTGVETTELTGYRPFPAQPGEGGAFFIDRAAYGLSGYGTTPTVRVGEPALMHGLRVVPVIFSPVRYDPARGTIEVARRVTLTLRFAGQDLRNARTGRAVAVPSGFDGLCRDLVVNYDGSRADPTGGLGQEVIICPDNADVVAALQPLIEWRTRKGFDVRLATTAETGTSRDAIKAWLQNAYDSWEQPPEYVALVGDADGAISIPTWSYSGGDTDHPYTQLDGTDPLSDVFLGRISVDTVDRLRLFVTKMVGYESTPYTTDTGWYTRGCLVGDPSSSGYTCVEVMQWVKALLLRSGYTQVDTVFTAPWVSQMVAGINRGDTVFSYRGYYGTSGFNTGHISTLTNGWKMPFAPTLTCGTGNFSGGTSISEAWIRAGTPPSTPTGGIASAGMSTLSTVTRYNNCLTYGIWTAIFSDHDYHFGQAHTRGKTELYVNYGTDGYAMNHTHWCNMMGDPAGELWTAVPQEMAVSHPAGLPLGANSITVSVTAHGSPLAGAYVCVWKGTEVHFGATTGADGSVDLPISGATAGNLLVTVTMHDHRPYLATVPIASANAYVGYVAHTIDDDTAGTSAGNDDGLVNPVERIELPVQVRNFGADTETAVTGTLTTDDPYVTILDGTETFGDIPAGGTAWCADDFDVSVSGAAPHGHIARFVLDLSSGLESWRSMIEAPIVAPNLLYEANTLYDVGPQLDPGETGGMSVRLMNKGGAAATGVTAILRSGSGWLTVVDSLAAYGDISAGGVGENTLDRFRVQADAGCFPGHVASLEMQLTYSGGATVTLPFTLVIGTRATHDPTGPDAYGYYAFDNTDLEYLDAPTYIWAEIDPNHGGAGTTVGLTDYDMGQDDSRVVSLPFPFIFYGQAFTTATICSNGWMAMGATPLTNSNNWTIPGIGAPPFLIAPMWDNLWQDGNNQVYQWYDAANHRFIVQWSRVVNQGGEQPENFEVILNDPAYHTTDSGDGEIIFQYETFNNSDTQENYCTVGIENGDQTSGVLYGYFNQYSPGSASIAGGRAIKFVTYSNVASGVLMGTVHNATDGGAPLAGATVSVVEGGRLLMSGSDGLYGGGVRVGTYTVIASHPSFAPDTAHAVVIREGETTVLDFALDDVVAPAFSGTTELANTSDQTGPYAVSTTVTEYSSLAELSLVYNSAGAGWVSVPMTSGGGNTYTGAIPGQPYGSLVKYYVYGEDVGGNAATDPAGAPATAYEFWVLQAIFADDMELGAGSWTHYAVIDTLADQWHISAQRNHTPGGANAWKFGDSGSGDYAHLSDGALESPPLAVDEAGAVLSFWHWIDAEVSGAYQGYAYDGGLIEMSVDGGPWAQVTPVGGYPYRVRTGSIPGPFPAETEIFSGSFGWAQVRVELGDVTGQVRFRFRFGSDGAVAREGWYLDDLELVPSGPGSSAVDGAGAAPVRFALHPATPNPFRGNEAGALLRFDLPRSAHVRLEIFDATGRRIRSLLDEAMPAGAHRLAWDGRDSQARPVASGVYLCVLRAAGERQSRSLLLVR